eukprot:COSAG05_NODE_17385_length_326_cov_0.682819_1_plen_81_part_01
MISKNKVEGYLKCILVHGTKYCRRRLAMRPRATLRSLSGVGSEVETSDRANIMAVRLSLSFISGALGGRLYPAIATAEACM